MLKRCFLFGEDFWNLFDLTGLITGLRIPRFKGTNKESRSKRINFELNCK